MMQAGVKVFKRGNCVENVGLLLRQAKNAYLKAPLQFKNNDHCYSGVTAKVALGMITTEYVECV